MVSKCYGFAAPVAAVKVLNRSVHWYQANFFMSSPWIISILRLILGFLFFDSREILKMWYKQKNVSFLVLAGKILTRHVVQVFLINC